VSLSAVANVGDNSKSITLAIPLVSVVPEEWASGIVKVAVFLVVAFVMVVPTSLEAMELFEPYKATKDEVRYLRMVAEVSTVVPWVVEMMWTL